jgi:hypothetical protein
MYRSLDFQSEFTMCYQNLDEKTQYCQKPLYTSMPIALTLPINSVTHIIGSATHFELYINGIIRVCTSLC